MNIIKTTLAIAAFGYLSLTAVYAAGSAPSAKRAGSTHKSSRSSSARSHTSHRPSIATSRTRDRLRNTTNNEETRNINGSAGPDDVNDQVELPRRENDGDAEQENDDSNSILMGTGTENDDGG